MDSKETIKARSFMILVIMFAVGTSILITPGGLAIDAKQDAWMAGILGVVINILLVLLYATLGNRYPNKTFVEYCIISLGPWIGKFVALLFVAFCYILASLMLGDMGIFLTSQIMPDTPMEILKIIFTFVIVMAIRAGLKVYTHAAEIFIIWMFGLFILLILTSAPKFHFDNLYPLLEFGIKPVFKGAYNFLALQEMVVLLMFYPYVSVGTKDRRSRFIIGMSIGGSLIIIMTLSSILVLGPALTANQLFPAYAVAKHINIGEFLERIESVMMFLWILSIFMKITLTFHASVLGMAQIFNFKDEKPFVWPFAIGMIVLSSMCYPSTMFVIKLLTHSWAAFSLLFMLILPLLVFGVSLIRRQSANSSN
ncbi:spore germination protein [Paenibacillus sp. WQ 127069]|uniref:Spore germination protein n=1 Tax=Paenibacillus baimaensis TaxID=2982185 RepID=A0ABT2UKA3_9BACL|nr:spore germination protein [Paenibacillus sp. WQ 127069]MCU6795043.1 spore germination protein [Paenibacillus sp. WQ 127069]